MNQRTKRLLVVSMAGVALMLTACGAEEDPGIGGGNEAREGETAPSEGSGELEAVVDPYAEYAAGLNERLSDLIGDRAFAPDFEQKLQARLGDAKQVAAARRDNPRKAPDRDLYYEDTLDTFYATRAYQTVFTRNGHLTPAGKVAWEALRTADIHALDVTDYHVEVLGESVAQAEVLEAELTDVSGVELTGPQLDALVEWLKTSQTEPTPEVADELVVNALLTEAPPAGLPSMAPQFQTYQDKQASMADLALELEVKLADGYLRFARDLRHKNLNVVSEVEKAQFGKEPKPEHHATIILARLAVEIEAFSTLETEEAARAHLVEKLYPIHEQYPLLMEALQKYRDIVANGGWEEIKPKALRIGNTGPLVAAVKRRLLAEGYYAGDIDETWNDGIFEAIKLYQETHQMDVTGESSKTFWRSLNKSAEDRMLEVEINVRRWHQSNMFPDDHYVYINIPDFHAEVWKDNERQMRFRIVTGNKERVCDPKTETWMYANATPVQHATMSYLVLNPYWNVPSRIEQEEYLPEMAVNPDWLEQERFEYYSDPSGYTVLRQLPGAHNALGRVKFIFPNIHNTYMHDTPKKGLFKYPIRAFSHGCMRVHNPMDFAEYILTNEGKWDNEAVPHFEKETPDHHIVLDDPIEVFIQYFTVRVDEAGQIHFLADPYKYIAHEINPPTAAQMRCRPEVKEVFTRPGEGPVDEPGLIPDVDGIEPAVAPTEKPAEEQASPAPVSPTTADTTDTAEEETSNVSVDALGRPIADTPKTGATETPEGVDFGP